MITNRPRTFNIEWTLPLSVTELESNWKVESFKRKAKRFLKAKSKKWKWKKNWEAESQKQKFYLYHFLPPFHKYIVWTTQKFHFQSYNISTSEILGKKWKVLSEKIFESGKRKAKEDKIIKKLKAKSKIFNFENCKRKAKAEVMISLSNSAR